MQNKCAEIKIRSERRAGELIKEGQEKGEIESAGGDRKSMLHDETMILDKPKPLSEFNIERIESHRWQTIASMPDDSKPKILFPQY